MGNAILDTISGLYGVIHVHSKEARDGSVKRHDASYLNDGSDFIVATDINYVGMACHCYGHSSNGQC
jgi:hypothetical protein